MSDNQPGQKREIVVILPDIRSVLNVGSIFRTADAAGVSKIYLCGYTPAPIDRFGRERDDINKAALGAQKTVVWEHSLEVKGVIKKLKENGYRIISIEQSNNSIIYTKAQLPEKVAFVFGNEVSGIDKEVLKISDEILEIPMLGSKESLNVSVTAGIILYKARE